MTRFYFATSLMALAVLSGGCFDVTGTLFPGLGQLGDGNGLGADGSQPNDTGSGGPRPVVTLTVRNPTPGLSETVILDCRRVGGSVAGTIFTFQPAGGRLVVDRVSGTARFVVDASDLNTALSFTCAATDENGASDPSNRVTVFPTP